MIVCIGASDENLQSAFYKHLQVGNVQNPREEVQEVPLHSSSTAALQHHPPPQFVDTDFLDSWIKFGLFG